MTDKEKYNFIDHVVHLTISEEDRLLNEHGGEYSRLQEDGIDSNEYYRIITERVINILKKNKNYMQEEPVSEDLEYAAYKFVMDNFGNPKEPLYKFDQRCFKAGAQWQKERMLIKACEFIRTPNIYVVDINHYGGATTNYDATVDKFKKYMEGC